jgi:hypothetical protein
MAHGRIRFVTRILGVTLGLIMTKFEESTLSFEHVLVKSSAAGGTWIPTGIKRRESRPEPVRGAALVAGRGPHRPAHPHGHVRRPLVGGGRRGRGHSLPSSAGPRQRSTSTSASFKSFPASDGGRTDGGGPCVACPGRCGAHDCGLLGALFVGCGLEASGGVAVSFMQTRTALSTRA